MHRIPVDWVGKRVFIVGGGPSLKGFDFERLQNQGAKIIAINDAIPFVPFADVGFTIDSIWMKNRRNVILEFAGQFVAAVPENAPVTGPSGRAVIELDGNSDWSYNQYSVAGGRNSGFAALNYAVLRGATEIYLLGYDMQKVRSDRRHFHKGYDWATPYRVADFPNWVDHFEKAAPLIQELGVNVYNCNSDSAVKCFEFADIDEVLS